MLIYLDFGTAAREIAKKKKKWFKQTEIKMQSYGLKASQRTRNKGQGQTPTHPAAGSGRQPPGGCGATLSLSRYLD